MVQVKLKVLVGSSAGKEIAIPVSRFLIGRGSDCHMRPKSDAISRNHCAILTSEDKVVIRDLNSRNGTFVNGERIQSDCELKSGDKIAVGKLEFEVKIKSPKKTPAAAKPKKTPAAAKPKAPVHEAEPAQGKESDSIDFDVTGWLAEADAVERSRRQAEPDTRQFLLDETDRIKLEEAGGEAAAAEDDETTAGKKQAREKKAPGKLPQAPAAQAATSRDAAAAMLKKFFNNR